MRNEDAGSLEQLAGTVVYTGVRGTTPTKRIAVLSDAYPPQPGSLAYETSGFVKDGSTCVLLDCASIRAAVDRAAAELRSNPLKALFRGRPLAAMWKDVSPVQFALDKMLIGRSPIQRVFRSSDFERDLMAETIQASVGTTASRESLALDAQVVSYGDYQTKHKIEMPKDRTGGAHREIVVYASAKPGQDVLIACGDAWNVGYAADLLPQQPLADHVRYLTNALPFLGDKHEDMPNLVKRFPHTVTHNAAQSLVRGTHNEIGYKEAALGVNYQTLRDVDSYEWIVRNSRLSSEKTGASLTQAMTVLDELRPHLRRVGIFDASTMEQHADAVAKAVEAALITWPKKSRAEVLTQCAQHVARVAFAPPAAAAEVVQSKPRIVEQQQDRSRGEERSGPSGGRGR